MNQFASIPSSVFDELKKLDTCTVSNAIERLNVRMRNEGFVSCGVRCRFPKHAPMLGYAVTGRVRSSSPPMTGRCYYDRIDFWRYVATLPKPRVLVLEDTDPQAGFGALVGEVHATIALALDCIGCVTNGSVRDLLAVRHLGFALFSGSISVSHAYAHLVEFGEPVEIGGLKISPGDLVHGDVHGVHTIPIDAAPSIPGVARDLVAVENELLQFCRSPEFTLEELARRLERNGRGCL